MTPTALSHLDRLSAAPDRRKPIDLVVIGGYLGAGKTTLLNAVLSARTGKTIAVLVNDFGSINVDGALIRSKTDDVILLENGCICCSIGDSLTEALINISARETRPDILLIEASGVSDPARIAQIGLLDKAFRLCAIAVLIDAEHIHNTLRDPYVGDISRRQIMGASVLIMTKVDLISEQKKAVVHRQISLITRAIPIVDAKKGKIALALLFDSSIDAVIGSGCDGKSASVMHKNTAHGVEIRSFNFKFDCRFEKKKLKEILSTFSGKILRAKGIVWLTHDKSPYELNMVGLRIMLIPFAGLADQFSLIVFIGLTSAEDEAQLIGALQKAAGTLQAPG
ncbi:CobW family GTP-binding protein [Glaciimonas immobilis]|uniref:G3E family GTPase n=1 Tax=Glaciimonas immobilis TaxID=728004 RepID=A0A840RNV6_9BURK|nr:CobW family GTP-binding protein [Glaciimonas immobilis]KAF3998917.1 GTP-binding protein [Glaciimonas immobilis]MBB5198321.1 G3E family GTPase [Glaciimonas immobilis]